MVVVKLLISILCLSHPWMSGADALVPSSLSLSCAYTRCSTSFNECSLQADCNAKLLGTDGCLTRPGTKLAQLACLDSVLLTPRSSVADTLWHALSSCLVQLCANGASCLPLMS